MKKLILIILVILLSIVLWTYLQEKIRTEKHGLGAIPSLITPTEIVKNNLLK